MASLLINHLLCLLKNAGISKSSSSKISSALISLFSISSFSSWEISNSWMLSFVNKSGEASPSELSFSIKSKMLLCSFLFSSASAAILASSASAAILASSEYSANFDSSSYSHILAS